MRPVFTSIMKGLILWLEADSLAWLVFQEKPKRPPSEAQLLFLQQHETESYLNSIKQLVFSVPSLLLILSYGRPIANNMLYFVKFYVIVNISLILTLQARASAEKFPEWANTEK